METSDPDDFLTLLWLADHPGVDLRAALVTPGGRDQCQLVRWGLDRCGRKDVPVGAFHHPTWWASVEGQKQRVSTFHYKVYGDEIKSYNPGEIIEGYCLLEANLSKDLTYLTGCAPKVLGQALNLCPMFKLGRWVAQGFFAGDNVVPKEGRLEKFEGKVTCASFNPGGAPKEALALLASDRIGRRVLVSKNVCHGVVWTKEMHTKLADLLYVRVIDHLKLVRHGLETMIYGLDCYLRDKGVGKAMHDIVAAVVALDESVVELKEVNVYRERGEWGAQVKEGTQTWISVRINQDRFLEMIAEDGLVG